MPFTLASYLMWGFFPAFFPLLLPASPFEILAHRVIWTGAWIMIYLLISGHWREFLSISLKTWGWIAVAGFCIAWNWGAYVVAINTGHVADAALGYFINPLFTVALGIVFLRERLRPWQGLAVAIATVAVCYLTFFTGQAPYISLILAASFGFYGLIKKRIRVSAAVSVAAESIVLLPIAAAYLFWLGNQGGSTFSSHGMPHALLLISSGLVTALPLLCFSHGAKKLPLATVGMLQYITPCMQMLWAVFVTNEHFSIHRWVGFALIGLSAFIYFSDLVRLRREAAIAAA